MHASVCLFVYEAINFSVPHTKLKIPPSKHSSLCYRRALLDVPNRLSQMHFDMPYTEQECFPAGSKETSHFK